MTKDRTFSIHQDTPVGLTISLADSTLGRILLALKSLHKKS